MRLTVIIPTYNAARFLPETLVSLRRAVDDSIDLLFVDDASTDATVDLIKQADLPHARIIQRDRNLGVASARNLAMQAVETDYLTFLDADDLVQCGYFPALLAAISELGVQFVRTDHLQQFGRERRVHRVPSGVRQGRTGNPRDGILPVGEATSVDYPYSWAGAYHRELADRGVLRFPELHVAEDRPWIWQLHLQAESFAVPDLLGLIYRREIGTSLTSAKDSRQLDFVAAMERVVQLVLADPDADRFLPKALGRYCSLTLHHLASLGRFSPEVARTFKLLAAQSLRNLPSAALTETLASMTPDQRLRIKLLMNQGQPLPRPSLPTRKKD